MKRLVSTSLLFAICCQCLVSLFIEAPTVNAMDRVRVETRIDQAIAQFGATGSGVLIAVLDRTVTAGSSSLSYDAGSDTHTCIRKSNSAWKNTCRKLIVKLNDDSEHLASFQFK